MNHKPVKLITLNIWGGHVEKPLIEFIKSNQDIDIFCLQEVYLNATDRISTEERKVNLNILSELQALLPNHHMIFKPVVNGAYGLGMLVKNTINVIKEGDILIHENKSYPGKGPTHSRNMQWIECQINNKQYSIMNVHGLWNGMGKNDSPERIEQSSKIKRFIDTISLPKVLCGDFNLRPDTQSLKMLENDMNNLITLQNIQSTRTSYYTKAEKFADYILTSPDVTVRDFKVLKDEVSDHSPLFLEFM